jgi:hypothetical protein
VAFPYITQYKTHGEIGCQKERKDIQHVIIMSFKQGEGEYFKTKRQDFFHESYLS